jgi:CheY-like chemotaxis protein/anti-sigma regulatory factor (Ser/Thr protein kinase)
MKQNPGNVELMQRSLTVVETAAMDGSETVRRIQTFARKSSAKEFELLDMRSLLNDAIEITRTRWQNEARLQGLDYQVKLEAENDLLIIGSASELREVFVNLIVNAVDAMPQGGCFSITCARKGNRLRLCFADTGTGMPDDVRERIFEPFFSTKGAQGTGLGLAVSYSIIERHGGLLKVESEVERGTTFTIDLPAAERDAPVAEDKSHSFETPPLSILVIDDEPAVRETLAEVLTAMKHQVVMAGGGNEALQKLSSRKFDLILTDLAMPEMDGWEAARRIRSRSPEIKIIMVTGYGNNATPPPGEERLVNAIIGKPFDFSLVGQTIAQVLKSQPTGLCEGNA